MKRTLTLLLAALFTLSPLTLSMTACKQEEKPAVTTGLDLLKDFKPDEAFRSASQKWADTENYTITYRHQFRFGNGVGDPHNLFGWQFSEIRDGSNVQYSRHTNDTRPLELVYLDGMLYVEKGDEKTKLTVAEDAILPYLNETLPDYFNDTRNLLDYMTNERTNAIAPLSDSIVKTATAVQANDTVVVTFQLNKEEATAMMGSMESLAGYDVDPNTIDILQGTYTVTFDRNGVITKTRCDVELTFRSGNQTFYGYDSVEYNLSYGDARVEAPKKAESYTDVTGQPEIPA